MFALLRTSATVTLPQFTSDLIGLLTGSITTVGQLSASCDQSLSKVVSIDPAGWTVVDAAAGTAVNGIVPKVIQSPWADSPTDFKNIQIFSQGTNVLGFNGFHTWNPTTHTGTLPHVVSPLASSWQSFILYAGSYCVVSATASHFTVIMYAQTPIGTFPAQAVGAYMSSNTVACFEYSRDDAWSTVANNYPSWFTLGDYPAGNPAAQYISGGFSKILNVSSGLDITSGNLTTNGLYTSVDQARQVTNAMYGNSMSSIQATFDSLSASMDANKNVVFPVYPLALRHNTIGNLPTMSGGTFLNTSIFACGPIYNCGDEIDIGTQRYFRAFAGCYGVVNLLIKEA